MNCTGFGERDGNTDDSESLQSAYILRHEAAASRSADQAEAVLPRLYSGRTARHSQDNRMPHKAPSIPPPSPSTTLH